MNPSGLTITLEQQTNNTYSNLQNIIMCFFLNTREMEEENDIEKLQKLLEETRAKAKQIQEKLKQHKQEKIKELERKIAELDKNKKEMQKQLAELKQETTSKDKENKIPEKQQQTAKQCSSQKTKKQVAKEQGNLRRERVKQQLEFCKWKHKTEQREKWRFYKRRQREKGRGDDEMLEKQKKWRERRPRRRTTSIDPLLFNTNDLDNWFSSACVRPPITTASTQDKVSRKHKFPVVSLKKDKRIEKIAKRKTTQASDHEQSPAFPGGSIMQQPEQLQPTCDKQGGYTIGGNNTNNLMDQNGTFTEEIMESQKVKAEMVEIPKTEAEEMEVQKETVKAEDGPKGKKKEEDKIREHLKTLME